MVHADDGLCVFDIYTGSDDVADMASMDDFGRAAFNLIHRCLVGARREGPEGGLVTGIGEMFQPLAYPAPRPRRQF